MGKMNELGEYMHFCSASFLHQTLWFGWFKALGKSGLRRNVVKQWISAASSVLKDWRLKRYCNNQYNQQTVLFHLPEAMFKHLLAHAESLPHVDSRTQYFTIFKKSVIFIHLVTFLNMLEPSTQQLVTAVGATGNQLPKPRLDFYQRNFSQLLL